MTAALSFQPTLVPSLALVHAALARAATETSPSPKRPHRTVEPQKPALLRASRVNHVAEKELDFFFTSDADDEASVHARRVIARWIATLSDCDQEALSLYFDPEPWPESIRSEGADDRGYALVLAHASPYERWPSRPRGQECLRETSVQLEAAVQKHGPDVLRHVTRRAEWSFATALRAYAKARGRAPSVLCPTGTDPQGEP